MPILSLRLVPTYLSQQKNQSALRYHVMMVAKRVIKCTPPSIKRTPHISYNYPRKNGLAISLLGSALETNNQICESDASYLPT